MDEAETKEEYKPKKLSASWTTEAIQDLTALWVTDLAESMRKTIDEEVFSSIDRDLLAQPRLVQDWLFDGYRNV